MTVAIVLKITTNHLGAMSRKKRRKGKKHARIQFNALYVGEKRSFSEFSNLTIAWESEFDIYLNSPNFYYKTYIELCKESSYVDVLQGHYLPPNDDGQ